MRLLKCVRDVASATRKRVALVKQHVDLAREIADRSDALVRYEQVLPGSFAELRARPELLESSYLGAAHV
jgi:branched-chain amino acid transport system ATP-binding protein